MGFGTPTLQEEIWLIIRYDEQNCARFEYVDDGHC